MLCLKSFLKSSDCTSLPTSQLRTCCAQNPWKILGRTSGNWASGIQWLHLTNYITRTCCAQNHWKILRRTLGRWASGIQRLLITNYITRTCCAQNPWKILRRTLERRASGIQWLHITNYITRTAMLCPKSLENPSKDFRKASFRNPVIAPH